jgi:GTP-binding protein
LAPDSAPPPDEDDPTLPTDPVKRKLVLERRRRMALPIQLAIVGRPNVGKSTLVNQLLGEERVMAGPLPGLTRDVTAVDMTHKGRTVRLVDTAGMRRWGAWDLTTPLEGLAVGAAKKALAMANVVALVVDGSGGLEAGLRNERPDFSRKQREGETQPQQPPVPQREPTHPNAMRGRATRVADDHGREIGAGMTRQDLAIAEQVVDEGRALVVVVNKVDALLNKSPVVAHVRKQLDMMHQCQGTEVVPVSALRGLGMGGFFPAILRTYDRWNARVTTSDLNRWLGLVMRHHPPPAAVRIVKTKDGKSETQRVAYKLKYLTQINTRPPTFCLFVNRKGLPEAYQRYLVNALRDEFNMRGVPIRLTVKVPENPHLRSGGKGATNRRTSLTKHTRTSWGERVSKHANNGAQGSKRHDSKDDDRRKRADTRGRDARGGREDRKRTGRPAAVSASSGDKRTSSPIRR